MHRLTRTLCTVVLIIGLLPWGGIITTLVAAAPQANALRISQVYGGGGNSGAYYTHDFIELFNAGGATIDVTGWSVQYAAATGATWKVTRLSGSIEPGRYYLIQEAQGAGGTQPLPTPDATGTIAMSATAGKVALVSSATALSGACPTGGNIVDFVGYGSTASCYEGSSPTPAPGNTTAVLRAAGGCADTDDNAGDFAASAPTPRNSAAPTHSCGVSAPALVITKDVYPAAGVAVGELATYTIVLENSGAAAAASVYVTDTLPGAVDFADWITQPGGADVSAGQLTWNGALASDTRITFTFAVTHRVGVNLAVVNTAEFSGALQTGSDKATYTTLFTPPYSQTFATCPAVEWQIYSVASNRDWSCVNGYMEANGFGGDVASDDWLISPAFDFAQSYIETLTFDTWTQYTDNGEPWPQLSVKYSTDYSGSGDPTLATWTTLAGATFSPANSKLWTPSGEIDVSGISGARVYFAFQYVSSGTGSNSASLWRVDNVMIYERPPLSIAKTAYPGLVLAGEVVTYTVLLQNIIDAPISDVYFTDTLPSGVDFAYWIEQPGGAIVTDDEITWNGAVLSEDSLTFTFAVTNLLSSGAVINTAEFSSTEHTGMANANFTVVDFTKIHAIQGDGLTSPLLGHTHTIEGVVVGDFQPTGDFIRGFFVQEEDADADDDPLTSEGIFIYHNLTDVNVGDLVRVRGVAQEHYKMTQLGNVTHVSVISGDHPLSTAATLTLPFSATTYLERHEGMLVSIPQSLYVTEIYNLGRGGKLLLSADARLMNPTQVVTPGQPAIDLQAANNLNKIILDDGSLAQNPDPIIYPSPFLSATNTVRGGDTVAGIVGVLSYSSSGWSGTDAYRIQPVQMPTITHTNPRPAAPPDVGGTLRVASFNVLNYFDTFTGCTAGVGGAPTDCRGANDNFEFDRQRAKIITAMLTIDADVFGLMEIENDGYAEDASAIDNLVDGLNAMAGAGTYTYVDADTRTGVVNALGTDAIKVGLIYKPATVSLVGTTAVLDSSVDARFDSTRNRPTLAQAFQHTASGEIVTLIVNHLKSKGSACAGDPDLGDGQGNCNLTRTNATAAMVDWLDGDPTAVGSAHYLIIGDLNSYAKEDPIVALETGGYTNLVASMAGAAAAEMYGYAFDGQWGTLDYAMSSSSLLPFVTGAAEWHINADEPIVLDYNTEYKTPGQIINLYSPAPYRVSDHDPALVGLGLVSPILSITKNVATPTIIDLGDTVTYTLNLRNAGNGDAADIVLTDTLPISVTFGGWAMGHNADGATYLPDTRTVVWSGDLPAGAQSLIIVFTATVNVDAALYNATITNTAHFAGPGVSGSASAAMQVMPPILPVIVTEFLPDPAAVADTAGEWLELYNPNTVDVDLKGWKLNDLGTEKHIITRTVIIPAGGHIVLGRNANPTTNGGVTVTYQYSGFQLTNTADAIILTDALGREVDRVVYTSNANDWPAVTPGKAYQLCNPFADNNDGSAWSLAAYRWTPPTSDYGSPGAPNDCAVLAISKSVFPQTAVQLGSLVTYTVSVANTGEDGFNIRVTDFLPMGLSGDDLDWTGTIAANTTAVFTIPAVVTTSADFYGQALVNTAAYTYLTHSATASATVTLATAPQLTLTKMVTPDTGVFPGDEVTYTLTLRNLGETPATGIALTDTLPWEMTFVAWVTQNDAAVNEDGVTWSGALPGNGAASISFRAVVRSDTFFIALLVTNTATYTADGLPDESASATLYLGGGVAPTLTKTVETPAPVYPGDSVTYTLVLSNAAGLVGGVRLTDVLPSAVVFDSWIAQSDAEENAGLITWSGELASFTQLVIRFKATVRLDPALYEETILNTVQATAANVNGVLEDEAAFTVAPQPEEPLLRLAKTVQTDGNPWPGDNVTYTLTLRNISGSIAAGVALTDALPAGLIFDGWIAQAGAVMSDEVVTWRGDLAAEDSHVIIFTASLDNNPSLHGQTITNTAQATADNVSGALEAQATFTVAPRPELPLDFAKAVQTDGAPLPGDTVIYTLTLDNTGGYTIPVIITDPLPPEMDFAGWITQNEAAYAEGAVVWTGELAPQTRLLVSFKATLKPNPALYEQTITNTATLIVGDVLSGLASVTFTVGAQPETPLLYLDKVVQTDGDPRPGDSVTYTLTLRNIGGSAATGVLLTDTLPSEVNFGGWIAQNGATVAADVITWSGELEAEASLTLIFTAVLHTDPALYGQTVANSAQATAENAAGVAAEATFTVRQARKIFLPLTGRNF